MIRVLLIALLAAGLLVAGCGGDDEGGDTTAAQTTVPTQAQTTPAETTETEAEEKEDGDRKRREDESEDKGGDAAAAAPKKDDDSSGSKQRDRRPSGEALRKAIAQCKQNVRSSPQLSADAKKDLAEMCERAGTGDPEELREISRQVCKRIITETIDAGPQREQALELCDSAAENQAKR